MARKIKEFERSERVQELVAAFLAEESGTLRWDAFPLAAATAAGPRQLAVRTAAWF